MRSDKKHIRYRAMHEARAMRDGTCEPLESRNGLDGKCVYLIRGVVGLSICNEPERTCPYIQWYGLETLCTRYKK